MGSMIMEKEDKTIGFLGAECCICTFPAEHYDGKNFYCDGCWEDQTNKKQFVCYFHCIGIDFSLGISICFGEPNIEIHLPFGFFRIGWVSNTSQDKLKRRILGNLLFKTWGYNQEWPN